jgi:hypothetical protein
MNIQHRPIAKSQQTIRACTELLRTRANCSRWLGKMMNRVIAGIAMDLPRFSNDINRPCFWRYDRFGNCKRRPHRC